MSRKPKPGNISWGMDERRHFSFTIEEITTAWAHLTAFPTISGRALAKRMGLHYQKAHTLIHLLEHSGYITHAIPNTNARVVNIPYAGFEFQVKKV